MIRMRTNARPPQGISRSCRTSLSSSPTAARKRLLHSIASAFVFTFTTAYPSMSPFLSVNGPSLTVNCPALIRMRAAPFALGSNPRCRAAHRPAPSPVRACPPFPSPTGSEARSFPVSRLVQQHEPHGITPSLIFDAHLCGQTSNRHHIFLRTGPIVHVNPVVP
jgi:hypothetical protein